MCYHGDQLIRLLESMERMKPGPEVTDLEAAWYRGTLHGIKLALRQVNGDTSQSRVSL